MNAQDSEGTAAEGTQQTATFNVETSDYALVSGLEPPRHGALIPCFPNGALVAGFTQSDREDALEKPEGASETAVDAPESVSGQELPSNKRDQASVAVAAGCDGTALPSHPGGEVSSHVAAGDRLKSPPSKEVGSTCEPNCKRKRLESDGAWGEQSANAQEVSTTEEQTHSVQIKEPPAAAEALHRSVGTSGLDNSLGLNGSDPLAAGMYQSAWILAPMVRISTLPFRLECLKYGADLVYTEEIVDRRLINAKRHENKDFGTIEYICTSERRCVFSTCELERGKVVLQLGTANATRALQAASVALQDVAAVDINMGCPKSFSIKGGMGAALMQTPDVAMDILKTLTRSLSCPITCKIRLLDTLEETLHSALKIPLIANGDFLSFKDAIFFQDTYGIKSLMFARGAMWDPSLFAHNPRLDAAGTAACSVPRAALYQDFIKRSVLCGAAYQSIKFTLQEMTARESDRDLKQRLFQATSTAKICEVFDLEAFYNGINHVPYANTLNYHKHIVLA